MFHNEIEQLVNITFIVKLKKRLPKSSAFYVLCMENSAELLKIF
jgi:hypothetical protein